MKRTTWWIIMVALIAVSLTLGLIGNFLAALIVFYIVGAPLCEQYPSEDCMDAGSEAKKLNQRKERDN